MDGLEVLLSYLLGISQILNLFPVHEALDLLAFPLQCGFKELDVLAQRFMQTLTSPGVSL